jgi:hypothetical protein
MLFAAVTNIYEGLSIETLLELKVEKHLICLGGIYEDQQHPQQNNNNSSSSSSSSGSNLHLTVRILEMKQIDLH